MTSWRSAQPAASRHEFACERKRVAFGCNGLLDRDHPEDFGRVNADSTCERERVRNDPVWRVCIEGRGLAAEIVEGLRADLFEQVLRGKALIPRALCQKGLPPDAIKETMGFAPSAAIGRHGCELVERPAILAACGEKLDELLHVRHDPSTTVHLSV